VPTSSRTTFVIRGLLLTIAAATGLGAQASTDPEIRRTQKAYEEWKASESEATGYYNRGVTEETARRFSNACALYKQAISAWGNALRANMGLIGTNNGYDQDIVTRNNHAMVASSEAAEKRRAVACRTPDGPGASAATSAASPSQAEWSAIEVAARDKARRGMTAIVIPHINTLTPFIGASRDDRAHQYSSRIKESCREVWNDTHTASERLGTRAVELCRSLAYWMDDDEASSCLQLRQGSRYAVELRNNDPAIAAAYAQARLDSVEARLTRAVGCAQKDAAYWRHYELDVLNRFRDLKPYMSIDATERTIESCENSDNLSGSGVQSISWTVVRSMCYTMRNLARYGQAGPACEALTLDVWQLNNKVAVDDPMRPDIPALLAIIARMKAELRCA
jgi:hypothetical protein